MVLKEDFPNIDIFFEFRNFLADVASIENRKAWEFFHVGFLTHGSEKHILWKIMLVKKVVIRQLKHLLNITNKGEDALTENFHNVITMSGKAPAVGQFTRVLLTPKPEIFTETLEIYHTAKEDEKKKQKNRRSVLKPRHMTEILTQYYGPELSNKRKHAVNK
eukprot:Seg532.5 transcript_id=Seg532.5/GoldUCD/mRNA.D3Y31 product="hypothetical protein" protein_id=Seg532.5/GoldUCD/D3Y31